MWVRRYPEHVPQGSQNTVPSRISEESRQIGRQTESSFNTRRTCHKLGEGKKNHVRWAYIAADDCWLAGQRLHTQGTAATNFQADQNKSENKTILTAEKCENVLRGNYSPFPPVLPACLLPRVQALNHSCHSVKRQCMRKRCVGRAGPGVLPACLAAWGPCPLTGTFIPFLKLED